MTPTAPAADRRREVLVFWALVLLSLLMTLKYFPGLEHEVAYAGNVFQAIYPDAFPNDPFIGPERSLGDKAFQISLFYLLPKIGGDLWLDDRFLAVVYLVLVVVSLLGIDRIAVIAGIDDAYSRLIIQLVFLRDHQILDNKVYFAHQADVNHVAFAIPAAIWLIYAALGRKKLWLILLLCILQVTISIRNAPIVIASALVIAAVNGNRRDRIVIAAIFAGALAIFYIAVTVVFPVPADQRVQLWDIINQRLHDETNPFDVKKGVGTMVLQNFLFLFVLVLAAVVPGPVTSVFRGLRILTGLGLVTWYLGGLYFDSAPDALKSPHLLPFAFVKALQWPQTFAYLGILITAVYWLRGNPTAKVAAISVLVIFVLLIIGPGNHDLWAALFAASLAAAVALYCVYAVVVSRREGSGPLLKAAIAVLPSQTRMILVLALAITIGVAFPHSIHARLPAWLTLAKTGVMGDASPAEWIGVSEYLRRNTPADTVVLAVHYRRDGSGDLIAKRGIATRSGRSTPVVEELSSIFSVEGWRRERHQIQQLRDVVLALQQRRWAYAAEKLDSLVLRPHLIILPSKIVGARGDSVPPFTETARVKDYVILGVPKR